MSKAPRTPKVGSTRVSRWIEGAAVAVGDALAAEAEAEDDAVRVYETLITVATLDKVWMLETEREMVWVVSTGTAVATSVNVTVGAGALFVFAFVPDTGVAESWLFVPCAATRLGTARAAKPASSAARTENSMAGCRLVWREGDRRDREWQQVWGAAICTRSQGVRDMNIWSNRKSGGAKTGGDEHAKNFRGHAISGGLTVTNASWGDRSAKG